MASKKFDMDCTPIHFQFILNVFRRICLTGDR